MSSTLSVATEQGVTSACGSGDATMPTLGTKKSNLMFSRQVLHCHKRRAWVEAMKEIYSARHKAAEAQNYLTQ